MSYSRGIREASGGGPGVWRCKWGCSRLVGTMERGGPLGISAAGL